MTSSSPTGSSSTVAPGKTVTVSGSGYAPGSSVTVVIYSTPQVLTTVVADASGNFTVEVTVPAGLAAGSHTLVASGVDTNGVLRYVDAAGDGHGSGERPDARLHRRRRRRCRRSAASRPSPSAAG